jgi:hypothetical protein
VHLQHTSDSTNRPETAVVASEDGISFYDTIFGKIAAVSRIRNWVILHTLNGSGNSHVCGCSSIQGDG